METNFRDKLEAKRNARHIGKRSGGAKLEAQSETCWETKWGTMSGTKWETQRRTGWKTK